MRGTQANEPTEVLDINGKSLYKGRDSLIPVAGKGIYIVNVRGVTCKVTTR